MEFKILRAGRRWGVRAVGLKGCRVEGLLGLKSLKDSRLGGVRARRLKGRRPLEAKAFGLKGLVASEL